MNRGISLSKIKQFFKFFIQGDAKHQCQLCGGAKLPRFNGTNGVAGNPHHICQLSLGKPCPTINLELWL